MTMKKFYLAKARRLRGTPYSSYSPHFKKVVGIAMIKKEFWDKKTLVEIEIGDKKSKGLICDLPFEL